MKNILVTVNINIMFMVNINDSSTWIPDGDNEVWACRLCRCVGLFLSTPPPGPSSPLPSPEKDEELGQMTSSWPKR